ncbi:YcfL family protein [Marinobacter salicampi]|uniref:YcfL family protein n=1 Tax=Marinobacter salicampi TaxID=435907 RepID=UPI001F5F50A5|nr:YcfL family protein [Marinobacter salicampi]
MVLILTGCASQPETNPLVERQELKVDPEVMYVLTVTEIFEERLAQPGGDSLLQIQFAVQAHTDTPLAWQVTWFDASGMRIKGVGDGYRRQSLLTGQTRYFKATAPHSRVTSYQLHLREPQ